jgi:16S rRNA (adenine1518-N6/adenine1519-N6)-dimethyltransferase
MSEHRPRKRFGQHFLTAHETIEQIVAAIAPQDGETIVEIGPGQAAITTPLAGLATTLHAIEFDRDLVSTLRNRFSTQQNVIIHEADALNFDYAALGEKLRIVGNLPYNISTPLLFHLLRYKDVIADMHFMLQKEVVERMAAVPGTKRYGRLTIMLGCHLEVVHLFDVPPSAFSPPPKVTSSVVRMRPIQQPAFDIKDAGLLEKIVKQAFSRRRKTLRNALDGLADAEEIGAAGLDPSQRPEQIPIEGWVRLANRLADSP